MLALLVISTDRDHRKIIEIERFTLRAAMSVKTTQGAQAVWEEARKIEAIFLAPPPGAIIPDALPLGTFENEDTRDDKTRYI